MRPCIACLARDAVEGALPKYQREPVVVRPCNVPEIANGAEELVGTDQAGRLSAAARRRVDVGLRRLREDGTGLHRRRFVVVPTGVEIERMRADVLCFGRGALPQLLTYGEVPLVAALCLVRR